MADHVAVTCRSGFLSAEAAYGSIRRSLTPEATKTLVQDFISRRLDYCTNTNIDYSTVGGVSDQPSDKLQSLQNAAARLVTGASKFDHITPVLRELHCMAASPTADHILDGCSGLQVHLRHGSDLPSWSLQTHDCEHRSLSPAIRQPLTAFCPTDKDSIHVWQQELCWLWFIIVERCASTLRSRDVSTWHSEHNWRHFCLVTEYHCCHGFNR